MAANASNKSQREEDCPSELTLLYPTQVLDIKIYSDSDFPSYLPKLNDLYDELFGGGKGFRAKLTQMICSDLDLTEETVKLLCQTIEFIHNSSLLHDDLVDRSSLRRGKTAAWLKYSPEYAVLAGDYLLARVMVNLSQFGNVHLIRLTSQCISDLLEGEWIQDSLVNNQKVTLEELTKVHDLKTASLFKWCLRAPFIAQGQELNELDEKLTRLGGILGILFQRSDDLLDFDIRNYEGKAIMGDLKSNYVNSFCAFLFADVPEAIRDKAYRTKDLVEFKECIGEAYFEEKTREFDRLNQALIDRYFDILNSLPSQIPPELTETLRQLPGPLYWRKAPDSQTL